jgi:hypothetical protein
MPILKSQNWGPKKAKKTKIAIYALIFNSATFKNESVFGNNLRMKFIIFSIFRETMTLSKIRMLLLKMKAFLVTISE